MLQIIEIYDFIIIVKIILTFENRIDINIRPIYSDCPFGSFNSIRPLDKRTSLIRNCRYCQSSSISKTFEISRFILNSIDSYFSVFERSNHNCSAFVPSAVVVICNDSFTVKCLKRNLSSSTSFTKLTIRIKLRCEIYLQLINNFVIGF